MKKEIGIIVLAAIIIAIVGLYATGFFETKHETITVYAGAGLMKAVNEMKSEFEKSNPGVTVNVRYGSGAEIVSLLKTQKSADVLIAPANDYMKTAIKDGLIKQETVRNVTKHVPVLIVRKGNPKNIKSIYDLTKPGIRVAVGDPKSPAIGKKTWKILKKAGIEKEVEKNIVAKTGTVNELLTYVATGQADAAIIWEDMATWSEAQGKIEVIPIPKDINAIDTVSIGVTTCTKNYKLAKSFEDFVLSPKGKSIWQKWGFKVL